MGWQDRRVLLAEIVATSAEVGATRSRTAKLAALTELLRRLAPEEVVPAVAALTGAPRQGRIGVGWRTVYGVEVAPAQDPCIELLELDATLTAPARSEERRVGKGWASTCRSRWLPCH